MVGVTLAFVRSEGGSVSEVIVTPPNGIPNTSARVSSESDDSSQVEGSE